MAVKKKKKHAAYDPYRPYGNHSLPWFQQQANLRATNDTNSQVAALPSSQFYTDSAAQLAKALAGIQQNQAGIASAGGDLYSQAFQNASAPANKAAMVAGGAPLSGPANTSLVGALGATMAQALSGGQSAAVARGRNDVLARAGQETAIRAKQPSAAAAYLKEMTDNALQARAAQTNEMLANAQFGLQQSDTNFDNQLNAAKFNADVAASGQDAASKDTAARKKARDKKLAAVQARIDKWTATVDRPNGAVYTFQPNLVDKTTGKSLPSFDITAKDGPSAVNAAIAKLTAMNIHGITGTQVGSWLKKTKPTTAKVAQKSKRDAYNIAVKQLTSSGLFTKKEAQRFMRDYFGVSQTGPLKL